MAGTPRLLIVAGPTASGKTACAVELALRMGGEVVSVDSMQVYRGMEVLSAAPMEGEMRGVRHHMLAVAAPSERFSAAAYRKMALRCIKDILSRGKLPVLCGGTGLYIDALTRPMGFAQRGSDAIRAQLEEIAQRPNGKGALHAMLRSVDPESADRLHPNDVRRVVRAIEIFRLTGRTQGELAREDALREGPFDEVMFALHWPREELYRRIDQRVDQMLSQGLIDEVRALMADEAAHATAGQAIGYKEIAAALRGECSMPEALGVLKQVTRNYAKRQLTWFRRDARVQWIAAQGRPAVEIVDEMIEKMEKGAGKPAPKETT